MKQYHCEQYSPEWYRLRLGKPTASCFDKIITPGGKPSDQARSYMHKLIAERLLCESMDDAMHTEWMERGKELEPEAARQFEFSKGIGLETIGFVTDEGGRFGCSPDRLVIGKNQAVEFKCPAPWTHIGYMLDGPGERYRAQVQGQLWIGEFESIHFYSYHPRMPAVHVETKPDREYIAELEKLVTKFVNDLDAKTEIARSRGVFLENPSFLTPFEEMVPGTEPITILIPE